MKQQICVHPILSEVNVSGSGDRMRFSITMRVFAGPANVIGRDVFILLDEEDARRIRDGITFALKEYGIKENATKTTDETQ